MTNSLPPQYDPTITEAKWQNAWEESHAFQADPNQPGEPYCVVIPPPNVTGSLHMGHAFESALIDTLVRYHRMRGDNTLWLPGTDHASIAVQTILERQLKAEGKTRDDLGREKFLERAWAWKEESGGTIVNQQRRLGVSVDWTRERFTMDEGLSQAVKTAFIKLYEEGLIYRGNYLVNWCPASQSAVSDLEVENQEVDGHLWYFRYPLTDGTGEVVVATTRPETMLGDTAVAVNPNDQRFAAMVGKTLTLPLMNREIPIVADELVDPEFGTGCVKVTPAHDPNDFVMGQRHNLPFINLLNKDGSINENGGDFAGQDRFEARKNVVQALDEQGFLVKVEDYRHSVPYGDRSKVPVEPMLSTQWFVKIETLSQNALRCLDEEQSPNFVPERWSKVYRDWLVKLKDWCISRQLWWGHQIPAWYVVSLTDGKITDNTPFVVAHNENEAREKAESENFWQQVQRDFIYKKIFEHPMFWGAPPDITDWIRSFQEAPPDITDWIQFFQEASPSENSYEKSVRELLKKIIKDTANSNHLKLPLSYKSYTKKYAQKLQQDPDVLDTWFSSGLWPFSTMGWPEQTADLEKYYPTTTLVTGFDIIFFWVARMTMMAGHFTGQMPFKDVYIHGLVRDENGKKMSKSANNGIDPLLLINKYGTDALRYTLIREVAGAGQDISLQYDRQKDESESVEASRNFANKLWNAARFVMMNLDGKTPTQLGMAEVRDLELVDRWILSRLNQVIGQTRQQIENYGLGEAAKGLYEFIRGDFCDWYIELAKPRLWNKEGGEKGDRRQLVARQVLAQGLDAIVKLLHPFMPHITEELWQTLHQSETGFLALQSYPVVVEELVNPELESQFDLLINTLRTIRNLRAEAGIKPGAVVTVILQSENDQERQTLDLVSSYIRDIGKVENLQVLAQLPPEQSQAIAGVVDTVQVLIPLSGLVDLDVLRNKIQKTLDKINKEYEATEKRLSNPGFVNKAPAEVIEGAREGMKAAEIQREMLQERLRMLG